MTSHQIGPSRVRLLRIPTIDTVVDVLIKWMRCRTTDAKAFDDGQRAWGELAGLPGFLGQCGGWSEPGVAHVLAFWRSADDHAAFLAGPHDRLAAAQRGSYAEIGVRLFERELTMDGPCDGEVVRLAHCHVREAREPHFVAAQERVWAPGMAAAPGMRGWLFGRDGREFLVLSWWRTGFDHARYQAERFPALRAESQAAADLEAISGDLVALEPAWTVPMPV